MTSSHHLVITVHGIRTFGHWQERLEQLLKAADPTIAVFNYKYGYFSVIAFMIPFLRWLVTRRFRQELLHQVRGGDWARIDIVAHSFGTHMVGWGLYGLGRKHCPKIHTVILAGTVLKKGFPWHELLNENVKRLVNECGIRDWILVLNGLTVLLTGIAGREGFNGMTGSSFRNRYFDFGHSGYFQTKARPDDAFMKDKWCPLLLEEIPIPLFEDPRGASSLRGIATFFINNAEPIKLTVLLTPLILSSAWLSDQLNLVKKQNAELVSNNLAFQAQDLINHKLDRAILLSVEANRTETSSSINALLTVSQTSPGLESMLHGHTSNITSLKFSRDGKILASASWDKTVRLWDVSGRRELFTLEHKEPIQEIMFSPVTEHLYSSGFDSSIHIWNTENGRLQKTFRVKGKVDLEAIALSPDTRILAQAVATQKEVQFWNVDTGESLGLGLPHRFTQVFDIAFSPDSKLIAVAHDKSIELWDVTTAKLRVKELSHADYVFGIAFSPNGKLLASASSDGTVRLWETNTGNEVGEPVVGHNNGAESVAFSEDGRLLASGDVAGNILIWEIPIGLGLSKVTDYRTLKPSLKMHFYRPDNRQKPIMAFSPDNRMLATSSRDGIISLWRLDYPDPPDLVGIRDSIGDVRFLEDGKTLASVSQNKTLYLWDVVTRKLVTKSVISVDKHDEWITTISPDGNTIAAANSSGQIRLWETSTKKIRGNPLQGHNGPVNNLVFSSDSKMLASSGLMDRTVRLWRADGGAPHGSPLLGHQSDVNAISFSPKGDILASVDADGKIYFWETSTPALAGAPYDPNIGPLQSLAFSRDGRVVAFGARTGSIHLMTMESREPVTPEMFGHLTSVTGLSFHPSGKFIASASEDGVQLWDVKSGLRIGKPFRVFRPGPRPKLTFSPDGKVLVSTNERRSGIYFWDTDIESWIAKACRKVNRHLTENEQRYYVPTINKASNDLSPC